MHGLLQEWKASDWDIHFKFGFRMIYLAHHKPDGQYYVLKNRSVDVKAEYHALELRRNIELEATLLTNVPSLLRGAFAFREVGVIGCQLRTDIRHASILLYRIRFGWIVGCTVNRSKSTQTTFFAGDIDSTAEAIHRSRRWIRNRIDRARSIHRSNTSNALSAMRSADDNKRYGGTGEYAQTLETNNRANSDGDHSGTGVPATCRHCSRRL